MVRVDEVSGDRRFGGCLIADTAAYAVDKRSGNGETKRL
ncbi:hypothetical protein HMPREF1508_1456 [Shuttleworthella sp. MSX8B]|nr:hypothetical protein HMPREF1508_1456 [Shuttleworthia sp. MSX8B]